MLGPHTHRDNPVSRIMCAPVAPPVTVCKHLKIQKKIGPFFVFPKKKLSLVPKMGKRSDKKTLLEVEDVSVKRKLMSVGGHVDTPVD